MNKSKTLCMHGKCQRKAMIDGLCKYCYIWKISHDIAFGKQEHIHCRKLKDGSCYCRCFIQFSKEKFK